MYFINKNYLIRNKKCDIVMHVMKHEFATEKGEVDF